MDDGLENAAAMPARFFVKNGADNQTDRMLRRREVLVRLGIGNSSLYAFMERGEFPRPRRIGPRLVAWPESEVDTYIANLPVADPKDYR